MDTKKIDLNLLVALEALLAERNVTRAARKLGLSQPAVSAQLARLRGLLGDPLLVPSQRGMTPTTRSLELQQPLLQALAGVRDVISVGGSFDPATAEMTIAIAGTDHSQYAWLMPFAIALRAKAPGLRLAFRSVVPETLEKQMEQGEIDLAVYPRAYSSASILSRKFRRERFVLIARRRHPIVRRGIGLEQFLALEHVITEPSGASFKGPTDRALEALGRSRRVVLSVSSFLVATEVVAQSDLIGIVPEGVTRDRKDRLQILKPPLDIPDVELLLFWHQRTHSHAGYKWVRDALVSNIVRELNNAP
jgi:DNA-binding transcriptional LysR family regulator